MEDIIKQLNWRYATKKFDSNKKITIEHLETLKKSISLSPSSMGLQAYKVLVVENQNTRELLRIASHNQSQVTDASHYFVFCAMTEIKEKYVETLVGTMANSRSLEVESLSPYKNSLLSVVENKNQFQLENWNSKQCYIALGFLLETAALLSIDSTPMEGFNPEEYNEILGLKEKGLTATVACALGYRSEEDKYSKLNKSRKDYDLLFEIV
jgi:nitroreductase / dihydropteridine reductase